MIYRMGVALMSLAWATAAEAAPPAVSISTSTLASQGACVAQAEKIFKSIGYGVKVERGNEVKSVIYGTKGDRVAFMYCIGGEYLLSIVGIPNDNTQGEIEAIKSQLKK